MNRRLILAAASLLILGGASLRMVHRRMTRTTTTEEIGQTGEFVRARADNGRLFLPNIRYRPLSSPIDQGGFTAALFAVRPWRSNASLAEIAEHWRRPGDQGLAIVERQLSDPGLTRNGKFSSLYLKAILLGYEGRPAQAYEVWEELKTLVRPDLELSRSTLGTILFLQGVSALRRGEDENCLICRGDSACLLPIAPSSVHTRPRGSRTAIRHFTEYLNQFPDDLQARWLLNLAHMTLGEYPKMVDPQYRLDLSKFFHSEIDIGAFREISHSTGLDDRNNQSGGAIMDDFDDDGWLDILITCHDPTEHMAFYHNNGDGTFVNRTKEAGLSEQFGGLVCYQADFDNDGHLDVFIPRGAWHEWPMRPSLLRNRGRGRFEDVTKRAGLLDPANSNAAAWADYDNDGQVDLFVACEKQPNRLYRNRGDGTFEEVGARAGVQGAPDRFAKGCTWFDYDNDDFPDLFVNNMADAARLYHNNRKGRFEEVTSPMGIDGPTGFSCGAFDYNNDGWLDIFAVEYGWPVAEVIHGMQGKPVDRTGNRLYRNRQGKGFEDVSLDVDLGAYYATMGLNYADFDNDGYQDIYHATGGLGFGYLVPNRMLKNVEGKRFVDISSSSRTAHLQKGHGVACGDWDRDGDVDLFVEMGGGVNGDKYHNLLFQNPGQGNHSLTLKLVGKKTNRAAIGARIRVVAAGGSPLMVYREVSSGCSFGGNPMEQTIGLARATQVETLEVYWPTSRTRQVFRNLPADHTIEVTEFNDRYRVLDHRPISLKP